jgi:hypothetical protein
MLEYLVDTRTLFIPSRTIRRPTIVISKRTRVIPLIVRPKQLTEDS